MATLTTVSIMNNGLTYHYRQPDPSLTDFVDCFWSWQHDSDKRLDGLVVPTGNFDLFIANDEQGTIDMRLIGLETKPKPMRPAPYSLFVISFRPLAADYLFHQSIADLVDRWQPLPTDFWGFCPDDLTDFETFCAKASKIIQARLSSQIDERKRTLFRLIFAANGDITVHELADHVHWSARQMNRYFTQQFGISLKAYCTVIRFRAAFGQIKAGDLFPRQSFADQSHFIKASKKLTSVTPKELYKNQNDRFVQFSVLPPT